MSGPSKNFLMENTTITTTITARSNGNAERSALMADALRLSGRLRLQVHGESMLPALWPGDVVEIASCSLEDVLSGEIVLARRDGRLFLHRLVSTCKPDGFLLRGDSMPGSDPQFPAKALLGRLVSKADVRRGVAGFGVNWFGVRWSRALGMVLCHCGVARRLALKFHSHRQASAPEFRNPEQATELVLAGLRSERDSGGLGAL
jgi:signal peptidase I